MSNWQTRAKAVMKSKGITQDDLRTVLGVTTRGAVGHYLSGRRNINIEQANALCQALGVAHQELFGDDAPAAINESTGSYESGLGLDTSPLGASTPQFLEVPYYNIEFSAGSGTIADAAAEVDSFPVAVSELTRLSVTPCNAFVSRIKGDSMMHTLNDGDVVLFDQSIKRPVSGKIFAFRIDDELRVKRFYKEIDGRWRISSDNQDKNLYPDEMADATLVDSLAIIGQARTVVSKDL